MDALDNRIPPWTEIMERIGTEIPRYPTKSVKNFSYSRIRRMLKFDQNGKCVNAFQLASSTEFLKLGYDLIKSKPGNMVHGSDRLTLDGLPLSWFEKTSDSLRRESYVFKPSRRVYIPKPNGKKRPLGISSLSPPWGAEFISAGALAYPGGGAVNSWVARSPPPNTRAGIKSSHSLLRFCWRKFWKENSVNTPMVLDHPKGCHSALFPIRNWKGVTWVLEGDIKSFFDNIDHNIVAELLRKHFNEQRLLNIYWKLVKAGYIEWDNKQRKFVESNTGVPQGGIISPLLSNLILHEFDVHMEKLIAHREKVNQGVEGAPFNWLYARPNVLQLRRRDQVSQ